MTLGENMRRLREARGLNLIEMSEQLGIGPNQISKYEQGLFEPRLFNLICIADFFGVSLDELTGHTTSITVQKVAELEDDNRRMRDRLAAIKAMVG